MLQTKQNKLPTRLENGRALRMSRNRNVLTGWKYAGFIGAIVGAIGLATYPIIISPYLYPEKWQRLSKEIRQEAGIKQEDIQPGNMKVKPIVWRAAQ